MFSVFPLLIMFENLLQATSTGRVAFPTPSPQRSWNSASIFPPVVTKNPFLLLFLNSTSSVQAMQMVGGTLPHLLCVLDLSTVNVFQCSIKYSGQTSAFVSSGSLSLAKLGVELGQSGSSLSDSLVRSLIPQGNDIHSTLDIASTTFSDLTYVSHGSTLISSGYVSTERLIGCSFLNITTKSEKATALSYALVEEGTMDGCVMDGCTELLGGRIVSGLTYKSLESFTSKNSSFTNSAFSDIKEWLAQQGRDSQELSTIQSYEQLYDLKSDRLCDKLTTQGTTFAELYFSCLFSKRGYFEKPFSLGNGRGGAYFIINTVFCNVHSTQNGGSIFTQGGSSYTALRLYIDSCSFINSSSVRYGGAVFCNFTQYFTCIYTSFVNCSALVSGGDDCSLHIYSIAS